MRHIVLLTKLLNVLPQGLGSVRQKNHPPNVFKCHIKSGQRFTCSGKMYVQVGKSIVSRQVVGTVKIKTSGCLVAV